MVERRQFLKFGLAAGSSALAAHVTFGLDGVAGPQQAGDLPADYNYGQLLQNLCPPGNLPDQLTYEASPYAEPFKTPLFQPPVPPPQPLSSLDPQPDAAAHQRYEEFLPQQVYELRQLEFRWPYHVDEPYSTLGGSPSWGWSHEANASYERLGIKVPGYLPGPTIHAHYGKPVLVRQINDLPPVGTSLAAYALPSTTIHLHNFHTPSESDGNPQDWIDSGEFWDQQYPNYPSGGDPREKLTTLWYHDHRLDFTAANVYAGLSAFYLLFDEHDTGIENDPSPEAWRLPGQYREGGTATGKLLANYDIPLLFHDVKFYQGEDGSAWTDFDGFVTAGWLGDQITVNRTIRPYLEVEPRKYRFRIVDGGPSRFYQLELREVTGSKEFSNTVTKQTEKVYTYDDTPLTMTVITGDGNFLEEPVETASIYYGVAQRTDVIIDFSEFAGKEVALVNILEQLEGQGPSGRILDPPDGVLLFKVGTEVKYPYKGVDGEGNIPDYFRPLPDVDMSLVKQHRVWDFDYDGGLWTINGRVMDPNRSDAGVELDSAEIWTFRNAGNSWSHPIHCHFTEFIILEINGVPVYPNFIQASAPIYSELLQNVAQGTKKLKQEGRDVFIPDVRGKTDFVPVFMGGPRRDVATLLPGDVVKVYFKFKDFLGKYVMHCHNVVHEDHAMMIRWDIVEPGHGYTGPKQLQSDTMFLQERPAEGTQSATPVNK